MEQAFTAMWSELLAGASVVAILIVGAIWAVMSVYFNHLKRNCGSLQTQLDELHFAINSLTVSVAEMKTSMPRLASGITEGLNRIQKPRSDVDFVNGNIDAWQLFWGT
ncbi:MAG: hypothetical protein WBE48_13970 [Xanthobacteraceae bacterium]|jgi:hypothetical protein